MMDELVLEITTNVDKVLLADAADLENVSVSFRLVVIILDLDVVLVKSEIIVIVRSHVKWKFLLIFQHFVAVVVGHFNFHLLLGYNLDLIVVYKLFRWNLHEIVILIAIDERFDVDNFEDFALVLLGGHEIVSLRCWLVHVGVLKL